MRRRQGAYADVPYVPEVLCQVHQGEALDVWRGEVHGDDTLMLAISRMPRVSADADACSRELGHGESLVLGGEASHCAL